MVPRALLPWLFPAVIGLAIVLFVALPVAVAAAVTVSLFLVVVGTIGFRRYQWVNSQDDFVRPGNRELLGGFDTLLRPQNLQEQSEDRPTESRPR